MNKPKQNKHVYMGQSSGYQRRRGRGECTLGKGGQVYKDKWEINFGGEHAGVHSEVEI